MARRAGKRYPLIIYRHIVGRWWFAMIFLGLGMFALAYTEYIDPLAEFLPQRWQVFGAIGVLSVLVGVFLFLIRYMAYVQPHADHLKLVTPFMRVNFSYKRIRKTVTTEMRLLFNVKKLSGTLQDVFLPLSTKTALVVELTSYPIPRQVMQLFLSRFFFKDATPHIVILVEDWLRFSSELESMRTGAEPEPPKPKPKDSILSRLPHNR
jgi:hypothetical protein